MQENKGIRTCIESYPDAVRHRCRLKNDSQRGPVRNAAFRTSSKRFKGGPPAEAKIRLTNDAPGSAAIAPTD